MEVTWNERSVKTTAARALVIVAAVSLSLVSLPVHFALRALGRRGFVKHVVCEDGRRVWNYRFSPEGLRRR